MVWPQLPKRDPFFQLFEESALVCRQAAEELLDLLDHFDEVQVRAERIHALEERSDEITYQVVGRLHRTFITPIDRQDILAIARSLDMAVDFIDGAASRLALYNIDRPTDAVRQFAHLILQGADALVKMTGVLHRRDLKALRSCAVEINHAETEGDRLLRSVVAGLFRSGGDPLTVIKWKEIYETLEEATDRLEAMAHLLEGVVVKNT